MDDSDFFRQKQLAHRLVSDCSQLLNCLYRKQSEKYSAKWNRGFSNLLRKSVVTMLRGT